MLWYYNKTTLQVTNITQAVAEAWRNLDPEERERYEDMARRDKERYDIEKASYTPPPGYSLTSKRIRGPGAPKRPSSGYFRFANERRGEIKAQNPDSSNAEISKILSGLWKDMPPEERKKHKDEERTQWAAYKIAMRQWKKKNDRRKKQQSARRPASSDDHPDQGGKKKLKTYKDDFGDDVGNHADFDDPNLGLGGMDPNPEEMMAASALQGVKNPNQYQHGPGNYGPFFGMNPMFGGTPASHFEMNFPYHHYGHYPMGNQAMFMAHLRGPPQPYHNYPGFMGKFRTTSEPVCIMSDL